MTSSPPTVAPPPVPADVGVIAALPIEVAPFQARLRQVRKYAGPRHTLVEGDCAGKLVVIHAAGVGRASARRGAELVLAGHRPRWLLSVGFAGALDPALRRNAIVLARQVRSEDPDAAVFDIDVSVAEEPPGAAGVRCGGLVTVDRIIRTAADKAQLRASSGADAVDMETHAVAQVCAERAVRFLAVRVVSDEAETDLPPEILSILGPTGSFRFGAAVGAIWKRPGSVKELWTLREHAHEAAERLGQVLPALIERLP